MVKSVYLHDLVTQDFIEIPSDKTPRLIGRARDCDLVVNSTFTNISRLQISVQYFPHGDILLTQKSSNCDTFYGPSEDDLNKHLNVSDQFQLPLCNQKLPHNYLLNEIVLHSNDCCTPLHILD